MVIVGKFSGRMYPEGFHDTEECILLLTDDEYKDEDYRNIATFDTLKMCLKCLGCPYAKRMTGRNNKTPRNKKAIIREIKSNYKEA